MSIPCRSPNANSDRWRRKVSDVEGEVEAAAQPCSQACPTFCSVVCVDKETEEWRKTEKAWYASSCE